MYKENFPDRIKKARIDAGYTQTQISNELNIPKSSISKYETGQLEPDLEKLARLADFYNVSIDWLLGIGQKTSESHYKTNHKLSDMVISSSHLLAFLATLSLQDKKLFLSGKMKLSQFTESKYFKKLTPEQKLYLFSDYENQSWQSISEDENNKESLEI